MSSDERPAIFDESGEEIGYVDEEGHNVISSPRYIFADEWVDIAQREVDDLMDRITKPMRDFKWGNRG